MAAVDSYSQFLHDLVGDLDALGPRAVRPVLAVDECANHPAVRTAQTQAVRSGLICRAVDLWTQLRVTDDGRTAAWSGHIYREALRSGHDVGRPVKGFSWPDEYVVQLLVAQLRIADRVVLISENTKRDRNGLRSVLENKVAPALQHPAYASLGVVAFMKRGKTGWQDYAASLLGYLQSETLPSGFSYIEK